MIKSYAYERKTFTESTMPLAFVNNSVTQMLTRNQFPVAHLFSMVFNCRTVVNLICKQPNQTEVVSFCSNDERF